MLAALLSVAVAVPPDLSWCRAGTGGARGWTWLTPQDRLVDADLYFQCTMVTPAQVSERRAIGGPHAMRTVSLWANDAALRALGSGSTVLPDGAAIAKLKAHSGSGFGADDGKARAEGDGALGLMWREGARGTTAGAPTPKLGWCTCLHRTRAAPATSRSRRSSKVDHASRLRSMGSSCHGHAMEPGPWMAQRSSPKPGRPSHRRRPTRHRHRLRRRTVRATRAG